MREHSFVEDGDLDSSPHIEDGNGSVVLSYCRVCCEGEGTLADECPGPPPGRFETKTIVRAVEKGRQLTKERDELLRENWQLRDQLRQRDDEVLARLLKDFRDLAKQRGIE